jgi:hypothetical protein
MHARSVPLSPLVVTRILRDDLPLPTRAGPCRLETECGKRTLLAPAAGVGHHFSDKPVLLALTEKRGLK